MAEILVRQSFDEEVAITVDNVSTLPAVYRSKEWAACQVQDDGGRCNRKFQHGWLARRQDGVEGLIGASSAFRVQPCLNEIKAAVRQQFVGREFRVI